MSKSVKPLILLDFRLSHFFSERRGILAKKNVLQLLYKSDTRDASFKFYAEMCASYDAGHAQSLSESELKKYCFECLISTLKRAVKSKKFPKNRWLIWGIVHDRDPRTDGDFWADSRLKPHAHLWVWARDRSGKAHKRVSTMMAEFGILAREEDEPVWLAHGMEHIISLESSMLYATHDTAECKKEHKVHYGVSRVVKNFSDAEFMQYRGLAEESQETVSRVDWVRMDDEAYELGYSLGDWFGWYDGLPRVAKEAKNKIGICRERYDAGIMARISEDSYVTRLSIFIQGEHNTGKSTAVRYALEGMRSLDISGGGTGKLDRLTPVYEAIHLDDSTVSQDDLFALADDLMCNVYHRNSGNSFFCGSMFVVTSNLSFEDWVRSCGVRTHIRIDDEIETDPQYDAIKNRFFICHVEAVDGVLRLVCDHASNRGNLGKKADMYTAFRDRFNEKIEGYIPNLCALRLDELNRI